MTTVSNWIVIQFVSVVFLAAGLAVLATRFAGHADNEPSSTTRRWTMGAIVVLVLWLGISFVVAQQGMLTDFSHTPSPFMKLLFASTLGTVILSAASPWGKRLAKGIPYQVLFGFQGFRILVEALLMILHKAGIVPVQMTFEGRNWDMITGILALAVLVLFKENQISKGMYALLNLIGLGLVLNVVIVGFLSLPTPFQVFMGDNTWITHAPFVWLPTFLVQVAISGHILSFRKLLMEREPRLVTMQSNVPAP